MSLPGLDMRYGKPMDSAPRAETGEADTDSAFYIEISQQATCVGTPRTAPQNDIRNKFSINILE